MTKTTKWLFLITLIKKPFQISLFFDPQFVWVPVRLFHWSVRPVCWALIWSFPVPRYIFENLWISKLSYIILPISIYEKLWILFNSIWSCRSFVRLIVRLTDFPDFHTGTFSVAFRITETRLLSERKRMSSN